MKKLSVILIALVSLTSCSDSYSPLDSYVKAEKHSIEANIKSIHEARKIIDSLNNTVDYHMNVDSAGYTIYNCEMDSIGRINYGSDKHLDLIIDRDND
jgi:hypothetical protein